MTDAQPEPAGRQRILDAALELFARKGPDATTMRDIAAAADVSPALVVHHFGSKKGLKDAVDERVIALFDHVRTMASELVPPATRDPSQRFALGLPLLEHVPQDSPIPGYVRRLLLSGDEAGHRLMRTWHGWAQELLGGFIEQGIARPSDDVEARAAFMLINQMGMILFHDYIGELLGADTLTPEGMGRYFSEAFLAYSRGVFVSGE